MPFMNPDKSSEPKPGVKKQSQPKSLNEYTPEEKEVIYRNALEK